jgi:hypothetical protein
VLSGGFLWHFLVFSLPKTPETIDDGAFVQAGNDRQRLKKMSYTAQNELCSTFPPPQAHDVRGTQTLI